MNGETQVPVLGSSFARLKADATYGPIHPGDLLTSSATPGHAMKAYDPRAGSIIGKAIDPLETGTGVIHVLLMPH